VVNMIGHAYYGLLACKDLAATWTGQHGKGGLMLMALSSVLPTPAPSTDLMEAHVTRTFPACCKPLSSSV
jgi:hypothetical protein